MQVMEANVPGASGARGFGRRGMTLVELLVALAILVIGAGAGMYGMLSVSVLARTQAERVLAFQAGQNALEALQGADFREAFYRYNATVADDPAAGASPGNAFDVQGLSARPGDPDGRVGAIEFPGDGVVLLENVGQPDLGMPRDLGGAVGVDGADHGGDYVLLPVLVRVQWRGAAGDQQVTLAATLSNVKNVPSP